MYIQERLYFYNFLLENLLKKIFNNRALSGVDMCKLPKNTKGIKIIKNHLAFKLIFFESVSLYVTSFFSFIHRPLRPF